MIRPSEDLALHRADMAEWPGRGELRDRRGGYHWKVTGEDGRARFVTVDDLDGKDWLGGTRDAVFAGLGRWRDGLAPRLDQLPRWLDLLGQTEGGGPDGQPIPGEGCAACRTRTLRGSSG
jgi:hypothetical protein